MNSPNRQIYLQRLMELRASAAMADVDVWPMVASKVQMRSLWNRRLQGNRLTLVVAMAVLALFLSAAVGYASKDLVSQIVDIGFGGGNRESRMVTVPLDLSQTQNGITVTLKGAYLKGDYLQEGELAIAYWITGADGSQIPRGTLVLDRESGEQVLAGLESAGRSHFPDGAVDPPPEGATAIVAIFDISSVAGTDAFLPLRFSASINKILPPQDNPNCQQTENAEGPVRWSCTAGEWEQLAGPFVFEFSLDLGKMAAP